MIKLVHSRVWAFDAEWVPDPLAGTLLYDSEADPTDPESILQLMWQRGGATEDDPTPFLKTALCRVVSIAVIERRVHPDGEISLKLLSLPRDCDDEEQTQEAHVVGTFLNALGEHRPQLVGFNSLQSDLKILTQRGLILGLQAAGFCARPNKPWEGVDYFARGSEFNVDLKEILSGWGQSVPSLHELAVQSGIPGKMDVDGNQVARLWLDGKLEEIVRYNELDALTTYLLWLRLAHFAGHFSSAEYELEQERVRELLITDPVQPHLERYQTEWSRLQQHIAAGRKLRGAESSDTTPGD